MLGKIICAFICIFVYIQIACAHTISTPISSTKQVVFLNDTINNKAFFQHAESTSVLLYAANTKKSNTQHLASMSALAAKIGKQFIAHMQIVGNGRLSFLYWDVYDIALYAPYGTWSRDVPSMLVLRYLRSISGKDIADRSIQEIRSLGFDNKAILALWKTKMQAIFPDVQKASVLSAVFIPNDQTIFFHDDKRIGTIVDSDFTRWFADIWLSERSSQPQLRRTLLGLL